MILNYKNWHKKISAAKTEQDIDVLADKLIEVTERRPIDTLDSKLHGLWLRLDNKLRIIRILQPR